ncbi:hypothetical protein AWC11_07355 [Mycobacterium interjectum]|nr:hypothetical protein AWC11_07355 [Mycobacterium interjectum]
MNYPIASTPNASVHQVPGSGRNKLAFTAQELEAIGQQLLAGFMRQVVLAIFGAVTSQNLATLRGQLTAWANGVEGDISAAAAELEALIDNAEQGTAAELGTALATLITGYSDLLNALYGAESIAGQILVSAVPTGIPRANISGLTGYLTNLTSSGVLSLSGLASGALPAGVTAGISQITSLSGYLTNLSSSGVLSGISAVAGLGGYLTNLSSSGVLALSGLASGALPAGVTAAISNVTGLGGYLTHLTSGGVLALSGLASGALPSGITLPGAQLTGALNSALTVAGQNLAGIQSDLASTISNLFGGGQPADPNWSSVVALLHMDGADGSTRFTDTSSLAADFTAVNGAVISTAQSKFGGAAASFPNSNSYLTPTANSSNFAFGTSDFTIECWLYLIGTTAGNTAIYDARSAGGIFFYVSSTGQIVYSTNGGGSGTTSIVSSALSFGAWHHVALCRSSGTAQLFIDGVSAGTTADSYTYACTSSTTVWIGRNEGDLLSLNGYLDELRITKGYARYTANFTPPTTAFPGNVTGGIGRGLNAAVTLAGNPISSLFNASGVIASKIAGALNPAVTFLVGGSNVALSTLLGNLSATGTFAGSAITGALAAGVTLAASQLTGLAAGVGTWLGSGGALPSATTLAASGLTGLATGIGAWLAAGGALPAATTAAITQITSLSGYLTNLSSGGVLALAGLASGALPSGITLPGAQLTGALNTGLTIGGTALSTLFSGGQLAASQIAGALNTAVTIAGQTVADVQANAASAVSDAADIGTAIENAAAGTLGSLGTIGSQVQTGFSDLISGLQAAFVGGNTASPPAASTADVIASSSAIQQRLATIGNGAEEIVDVLFNTYSNGTLPNPPWSPPGTGTWTVSSGVLTINAGAFSGNAMYSGASFLTDYQQVSAVFTALSGGHGGVIARGNSTGSTSTYVQYDTTNPGYWSLFTGGTELCRFTDTITLGSTYTLVCGDPVNGLPRNIQVLKDGVALPILTVLNGSSSGTTYTDSNSVTSVGGGFRTAGIYGGVGFVGSVSEFHFQDTTQSQPSVLVTTPESTTSTTYTDLTTVSDEVAVVVGASGKVVVNLSANISNNTTAGGGFMGFEMSGANTAAADDTWAIQYQAYTGTAQMTIGAPFMRTGLNPGLTVFKAKYKRFYTGTATFSNRRVSVVAL